MKITKIILCFALMAVLCISLCSCRQKNIENIWENATYNNDKELGEGAKALTFEVRAGDRAVSFLINTDKETLGDVLVEHDLISGEKGAYGLYVKVVNGITADYDIDQSYWALTKNGKSVMTGVDGVKIADGEHYEMTYTK